MSNLLYELQKFVNEKLRLEKSVVNRYGATLFFTVKDGNILLLGSEVPSDAEDNASIPSYGKYILLIGKGEYSYSLRYEVEALDENMSRSAAQARAVQLTEANKNTIKDVLVCIGLCKSFAGRPIYQAFEQYSFVSKQDELQLPTVPMNKIYNDVSELPDWVKKKFSGKKLRQWMHVWNSSYKEHGDEGRAFASANSVVGNNVSKGEPDSSDVHVDGIEDDDKEEEMCPHCKVKDCICKAEEFEHFVPLKKNSLVDGLVYGIVYEPMIKDAHGDWTTAEEIEKWAHDFLPSAIRNTENWTDKNHSEEIAKQDIECVESYIAPCDFKFPTGEPVIKGSWVLVSRVNSEEMRKAIENDEISGYSLAGTGKKIPLDLPL